MTERTEKSGPRLVTPAVAAKTLGITTTHLARLNDRGVIAAVRRPGGHRRYAEADVEALLSREPWDAA